MNPTKSNLWPDLYHDYLFGYAQYKLDDKELIKDLIQDTFLYAYENISQFENRSSEITWLTAILKYKIYRVYRLKSSNRLFYMNSATLQNATLRSKRDVCEHPIAFSDLAVNKEFITELDRFIGTLPNKWQQLYNLKYEFNERTLTICEKLNLTPANYWVMKHRLKLTLKNWYLKNWN